MQKNANLIISVQPADISRVASAVKIPVWAQHVDNIEHGKNTGFILPESVKAAGAAGTLLNHAEHKLDYKLLESTINKCKALGLTVMVCASDKKEAATVAKFKPDFIAVEPPGLIGSGVSVASAEPDIVTSSIASVKKVNNIPVVCGAGITNGYDVKKAIELGTVGALVASAFATAENPEAVLKDLVEYI